VLNCSDLIICVDSLHSLEESNVNLECSCRTHLVCGCHHALVVVTLNSDLEGNTAFLRVFYMNLCR